MVDINRCAQADYQKSDKKLNASYQAALKRIESTLEDSQQRKDTKQGLIEAQRLWVQFRDKDCGAIYDLWRDGTIRGAMYSGCMTAHTDSRTKDLESFANDHYACKSIGRELRFRLNPARSRRSILFQPSAL